MEIAGRFPEGIITADGRIFRDFMLLEQTFRTTLEIAHDQSIDKDLLDDEVYYSACLMAKRLTVDGIDNLSPEQVLDLSAEDAAELINKTSILERQRANFRDAAQAAAEKGAGAPETGLKPD
jgi:hypothetical protein